jgi:hypothetical protein
MLVKCPLYLSQGPAAEMWSVVHFPWTRISTLSLGSSKPLSLTLLPPKWLENGSSISNRCESGLMTTSV